MSNYDNWTVVKLKQELSRRGAVTTGRKEVLLERLEAYDRNCNFCSEHSINIPDDITLPQWPTCGFKQLLTKHREEIPPVTRSQITGYFEYRMASDGNAAGDLQAIKKGTLLLEANRIEACSFMTSGDDAFFTGIVRAAMKKKISYTYKLRIGLKVGEILNSNCDCPGGKGLHSTCKHVAAVLLMMAKFKDTGVLVVDKTCTEVLQVFHKPKRRFDGSPIKNCDLPTGHTIDMSDPRPRKYRNRPSYNDHVRNCVINYCCENNIQLTMLQMYDKADIQNAAIDHDYLMLPMTEYWVDQGVAITEQQRNDIERKTRKQSKSRKWREEHSWRITASRFGEICKITSRRNKTKLCQSVSTFDDISSPAIAHGKQYEPIAIQSFERRTGLRVKPIGMVVSDQYNYLAASPDGLIDDDHIVEVKCPYTLRHSAITKNAGFPFLEISNGSLCLKKSHKYYDQIQGQLYICHKKICYFVVYTFEDVFIDKVEINRDYCESCLFPKLAYFYENYYRKYIAAKM